MKRHCPFEFGCIQPDICSKFDRCIWGEPAPDEPKRPIVRKVGSGRLVVKDGKITPEKRRPDCPYPGCGEKFPNGEPKALCPACYKPYRSEREARPAPPDRQVPSLIEQAYDKEQMMLGRGVLLPWCLEQVRRLGERVQRAIFAGVRFFVKKKQ